MDDDDPFGCFQFEDAQDPEPSSCGDQIVRDSKKEMKSRQPPPVLFPEALHPKVRLRLGWHGFVE